MSKIGYTFTQPTIKTQQWFDDYGLDELFTDKSVHERNRPQLKEVCSSLKTGDELIITKFSNAVRSINDAMLLIDLCRLRGARLISVEDEIDTNDILFDIKSTAKFLHLLSSLPGDIIAMRQSLGEEKLHNTSTAISDKKKERVKRDYKVISLYLAGHSLEMIMRQTGIKHSSLYNILKRNGIGRDRIISKSDCP